MNVRVEIDDDDDRILAIYITLGDGKVSRTVEIDPGVCNVDENEHGRLLGVEILSTQHGDVARSVAQVTERYPSEAGLRNLLDSAIGRVAV